jgi:DNA-binding NarL/FixJ family response regulator
VAGATCFPRLTRRERQVALLVARGLTNRQIAEELVVSERTVEMHVSNILGKLDLTSRAQVAVWAAERLSGRQQSAPTPKPDGLHGTRGLS